MGLGLVGSVLGFGGKRAAKQSNRAEEARIRAALGELTPEAIQGILSKLFTQYYGQMNPVMQMALSRIGTNAGRYGMTGAGVTQQLKAGVPGQFANLAMGQAIPSALGIAGQRAGIQASKRYKPVPTNWNEQMRTAANFWSGFFGAGQSQPLPDYSGF